MWDLFFNNLTAGFMFVTMITWLTAPALFGPVMPIALTLAFFIVLFDLLLLVADLGDHVRFLHAMRVLHPTSPLSVGVVGLIFYSIMLFIALAIYWVTVALLATIGLPPEVVVVLDVLFRLFAVLALIAACVVICYKGVVFSCTSQPGLKKARWLTCWVASDGSYDGNGASDRALARFRPDRCRRSAHHSVHRADRFPLLHLRTGVDEYPRTRLQDVL